MLGLEERQQATDETADNAAFALHPAPQARRQGLAGVPEEEPIQGAGQEAPHSVSMLNIDGGSMSTAVPYSLKWPYSLHSE